MAINMNPQVNYAAANAVPGNAPYNPAQFLNMIGGYGMPVASQQAQPVSPTMANFPTGNQNYFDQGGSQYNVAGVGQAWRPTQQTPMQFFQNPGSSDPSFNPGLPWGNAWQQAGGMNAGVQQRPQPTASTAARPTATASTTKPKPNTRPRPTPQQMQRDLMAKRPPGSGSNRDVRPVGYAQTGGRMPTTGNTNTVEQYGQQNANAMGNPAGAEPADATAQRNLPWNQGMPVQALPYNGNAVGDFGLPETFSPAQQAQIGASQANYNARYDQIAQQFNRPQGEGEGGSQMYQPQAPADTFYNPTGLYGGGGNRPVLGQPNPTGGRVTPLGGAGGMDWGTRPGGGTDGAGQGMMNANGLGNYQGAAPPPGMGGGPRPVLGQPNPTGGQAVNEGYGNGQILRPGGGTGYQQQPQQTGYQPAGYQPTNTALTRGGQGGMNPALQYAQNGTVPQGYAINRPGTSPHPYTGGTRPNLVIAPQGYGTATPRPGGVPQFNGANRPMQRPGATPTPPQQGGAQFQQGQPQNVQQPNWGQMFGVPQSGYQTATTTQQMPTQTFWNMTQQQYRY